MSALSPAPTTVRGAQPGEIGRSGLADLARSQPAVLIVGADENRLAGLGDLFESEGFRCRSAQSPSAASRVLVLHPVDLIILDGRLSEGGAIAACARLAAGRCAPIIILSDDADVTDRIIALEVGADELLARQFDKRELLARARALIRRSGSAAADGSVRAPQGALDLRTRMLVGPKGRESLPPAIFDLLWMFLSRPGQLITHKAASELLGQGEISDGYLRTSVARLRRKLSLVGLNPACLALVRSEGYALDPDAGIEVCDGMGERPQGSPGRLAPFASQER